jgi:hypothetical protein
MKITALAIALFILAQFSDNTEVRIARGFCECTWPQARAQCLRANLPGVVAGAAATHY